jgi:hypothetical protein
MTDFQKTQRGEGKLGCILTFLVVVLGSAVLIKLGPVYYSNMELADRADSAASMASRAPAEQVEAEVRSKAKELEIQEALKPGAIRVSKTSNGESGNCRITLKYTRKVDFWGYYSMDIKVDKTIDKVIFTNI